MSFYAFEYDEREEMENNEKYFSFYKKLPTILFWVVASCFWLVGIILLFTKGCDEGVPSLGGFGLFILFAMLGFIFGFLCYVLSKLKYSYMILHIAHLECINQEIEEIKTSLKEVKSEIKIKDGSES